MIIFKELGRLGNQLFQYSALKTLCQHDENLIIFGFEELQTAFDGIDATIINLHTPRIQRSLYFRFYKLADNLSKKKFIPTINDCEELSNITYDKMLFKNILFVRNCFFQGESFFEPKVITSLTLKPELLAYAQKTLNEVCDGKIPVFVHIRRGDYVRWPSKDHPAILPASYYRKCLKIVQAKIPNSFFIFTSDDPFYIKDVFGDLKNSYISQGSSYEDFALMTQCRGGILSPSSFAWWAAYLSYINQGGGIFLAPEYWIGHRLGYWYPTFIKSSFLTYIEV